ncbi:MAG TPA: hypothetical protein VN081_06030 [Dongiaceae bacterium]|nr:hypothetical protein [Dongiaceae bacterium]
MFSTLLHWLQTGARKNIKLKSLVTYISTFTAALGIASLLSSTATFAANSVTWTGNGTTNGFCSTLSSDTTVPAGQQQWLFILSSPAAGPWTLTASFSPATSPNPITVAGIQQGGGSIHFTVNTTIGAQLLSASATNGNSNSVLTVSHCGYHAQLLVTKTAQTSYTRNYDWTINKTVDQTSLLLAPGEQYTLNYTVTVTKDNGTDSNWAVAGTVTIVNTDPLRSATGVSVVDTLSGIGTIPVTCPDTTIAPNATMVCSYGPSALPDASSRVNSATATTATADIDPGTGTAGVVFGDPTTVLDNCVDISDTFAGSLGNTCASNSYTYSRTVIADLLPCGTSMLVNTASLATDNGATKTSSADVVVTVACAQGCTLTQGYWKTHSSFGPAPYDNTWAKLPNGASTSFFLSGQTWYQVFQTPPAGNAYYQLADQYMAARLNVLNGASAPSSVQQALTQATTLFGTYTPAQIAAMKANDPVRKTFITLAGLLGSYNEGLVGPGHCSE